MSVLHVSRSPVEKAVDEPTDDTADLMQQTTGSDVTSRLRTRKTKSAHVLKTTLDAQRRVAQKSYLVKVIDRIYRIYM